MGGDEKKLVRGRVGVELTALPQSPIAGGEGADCTGAGGDGCKG